MTNSQNIKAAAFSAWLRGQMQQRNLSNRALGKLIDPDQPERGRRRVLRHLTKHFPSAASRATYVRVFDLDGDPFTDDEADEDQALARELRSLLVRLERRGVRL